MNATAKTTDAKPAPRGRKPTGKALTSTERSRKRREALAARTITVELTPVAAAALQQLQAEGLTVNAAVSWALVNAGRIPPV